MKQIELSSKTRSSPHWTKLAAASVVALFIAGCGGGSDAPAPVVVPPVVTPPVVVVPVDAPPAGTAVLTAAAANPATTNTAANPAQAFGLIQTAGANSVTIQSPPVVHFTVIGSDGKFVPGLKLANTTSSAAGLAADANCSQNNVTFAIAKFDGTNWQNLISRQRYATADTAVNRGTAAVPKYRYAVAEGTTDPKPTAPSTVTKADGSTVANFSFANPATAVTDPATRIVGILEENAAGGYYTYRFATDVSTPLTMANAVDVKNVSVGKVANNGNVAVKDGKTLHRIGAQLCYTDPVTKAKTVVNPYIDFTLAANGVATPVKAANGTLTAGRKVVGVESCNSCHAPLVAHGTRVDPNYCVICHNAGSIDFNTNNTIDLKSMAHKLHGGKNVLTKDYSINGLAFKLTDPATKLVIGGTAFPQDVKNCATCHETQYAAQAENWKSNPSRAACGACHDGIDFATGLGVTLADYVKGASTSAYGHVGGRQADDAKCTLCHSAADTPVYHAAAVKTAHNSTLIAGVAEIAYEIGSVTLNTSRQPVVTFKITKNGAPVTAFATPTLVVNASTGVTQLAPTFEPIAGFANGPSIYVAYSVPQDGIAAPADFNVTSSASLGSLLAPNTGTTVAKGTNINTGTLTYDATTGFWTATLKNSAPSTTATALPITVPANASLLTGAIIGTFLQKDVPGYPYTPAVVATAPTSSASGGFIVKSVLKQKVATGFTGRRVIVDSAKCNNCHEQLGTDPEFHGGARNDANACAFCHNPNRSSSGWAADSRTFIHGIHGMNATAQLLTVNRKRTVPYTWAGISTTNNYSKVVFPGDLKKCTTCHFEGTYDFTASAYTPALLANLLDVTVASGTSALDSTTSTGFRVSPYVDKKTATNAGTIYGAAFSYNVATGVTVEGAGTNLVNSPIASACFSCHDTATAQTHMANDGGGSIYAPRSAALAKSERCLDCHAAGKASPIKTKHKQ